MKALLTSAFLLVISLTATAQGQRRGFPCEAFTTDSPMAHDLVIKLAQNTSSILRQFIFRILGRAKHHFLREVLLRFSVFYLVVKKKLCNFAT